MTDSNKKAITELNKILVIDDSEDFRNLLLNFFGKVCPDATIDVYNPATDGRPSETFVWDKYNLLILDYDLGNGENGLEWLRLYKTSRSFPPTIMLTAHGTGDTVVEAFKNGAQDYLRKDGLTKGNLIASIDRALTKYQKDIKKADTQQFSVHLYNKEKFYRSLEEVKNNDIVILTEIDKFQNLKDDVGILSADKTTEFVLKRALKYLTDSKHSSKITRISDSSIAILIRKYQEEDKGKRICEQLCEIFDGTSFELKDRTINFSLNIASVYVSNDTTDADEILKQADTACRVARTKPGNAFVIYETENNDEKEVDEQLDKHIGNAFNENRVRPKYQAYIKLSSVNEALDSIEYYQVRIHLIDLDDEIIEAREFIPVLKNKKMQKDMDRWVIKSCIQKIATDSSSDTETPGFSIALTEESLQDIEFSKWLDSTLNEHEISDTNNAMVFEISIDNYMSHHKQASFLIKTLSKKYNILFALTEITECTALENCLSQSKFDFIMFTPFANEAPMAEKEVESILETGKKYSCLSVANKIESNEAMMAATRNEFDFISGFFLQPPQENITSTEFFEVEI